MKASWFSKGMLGKFVSKNQANINKGKRPKNRRNQKENVIQKGVDGPKMKDEKDGILKRKTKGKQGKNRIGRREGF